MQRIPRSCAVLLCLLLSALAACGEEAPTTGDIQGTVTLENGDPAAGIPVSFQDREAKMATDQQGSFLFSEVPTGKHTLVFRKAGYVTARRSVVLPEGERPAVNVTLMQTNRPPSIDDIALDPEFPNAGESVDVSVSASDPNPDELTYSYSASNGFDVDTSNGASATLEAPESFDTHGTLTVTVEDPDGKRDIERVGLETATNHPPVINGMSASPTTIKPGKPGTVEVTASDPDSDELTYQWSAPIGWSLPNPNHAEIPILAPGEYGETGIFRVTVTDEKGASVQGRLPVTTSMNQGPIISDIDISDQTVPRSAEIELDVTATDPNDDTLSYEWSGPSGWSFKETRTSDPTVTSPDRPAETATLNVTVSDPSGASAKGSVVVSTRANSAPVIENVAVPTQRLTLGGSTDIEVDAVDAEGDTLTYMWSVSNGDWSTSGSGNTRTIQAPSSPQSSTNLTVTVQDALGATSSSTVTLQTVANSPPRINSIYAAKKPVARSGSTQINVSATDPNDDSLSYTWSVDDSSWSISGNGTSATLTAPSKPNTSALVSVTASDGNGGTASTKLQIATAQNERPKITSAPAPPKSASPIRGPSYTYQAQATDADDSNLTWSVSSVPKTSVSIDASGKLTWTPSHADAGEAILFTVTASDGQESASQYFQASVSELSWPALGAYPTGNGSTTAILDFTGDGLMDVAATRDSDQAMVLKKSDSSYASFATSQWASSPPFASCTFSLPSMPMGTLGPEVISICEEDGSGNQSLTLAVWDAVSGSLESEDFVNTGIPSPPTDAEVTQLDGTGAPEVAVSDASGTIHLFERTNSTDIAFNASFNPAKPSNFDSAYSIEAIEVGDTDADPEKELIALETYQTTEGSTASRAVVFDLTSSETIQSGRAETITLSGSVGAMELGDVDDDGDSDLVFSTSGNAGGSASVEVYTNDGSGAFSSGPTISPSTFCNAPSNQALVLADIDQDGHTDIVVGDGCNSSIHVMFGNTAGTFDTTFRTTPIAPSGTPYNQLHIGQANSDGYPDVFVSHSATFSIFR